MSSEWHTETQYRNGVIRQRLDNQGRVLAAEYQVGEQPVWHYLRVSYDNDFGRYVYGLNDAETFDKGRSSSWVQHWEMEDGEPVSADLESWVKERLARMMETAERET